jgi:iron complex transport system substrate-binding protein
MQDRPYPMSATLSSLEVLLRALILVVLGAGAARAQIAAVDDAGRTIRLERPARRIVSLAPHITEQLYAAGAGAYIVGAVDYSDFPPEAKRLPRVGDSRAIDVERLLSMKPDLVVAWPQGNPDRQLEQLLSVGLTVYYSQPRTLEDVGSSLARLGVLAGTERIASEAGREFRERMRRLRERYAEREPVTVFYQIWNRPLYTVNGQHLISDVIRLCGGRNVFAGLPVLAPAVTQEAVLKADPVAIIASAEGGERPQWLDEWKEWPDLRAVKFGNLYTADADLLHRHGPRIADGAQQVCEMLDTARARMRRR